MTGFLSKWRIAQVVSIEPIASYWGRASWVRTRDGAVYVLKEREGERQVRREFALVEWLRGRGLPVAVPLESVDGEPFAERDGRVFCLYARLPGESVEDHYDDAAEGKARRHGEAIGRLHAALCDWEGEGDVGLLDLRGAVVDWALPRISARGDVLEVDRLSSIGEGIARDLERLEGVLPRHLIHRDINPSNMLFVGEELGGILDFDMARVGMIFPRGPVTHHSRRRWSPSPTWP
ncbi:MAG: phosphotransferase [Phycisphaerae bacterium]|nr:phosphotransferase [Phycisphaerae bacterium]